MAKPNQPADPPMTSRHETHEWKTLDAKAPVFTCTRCWIDGGDPWPAGLVLGSACVRWPPR